MKILHTADWQLGKPYGRIEDPDKRAAARRARLTAIDRLAEVVRRHEVTLVVVAGDLFDAVTVDKATVSAACAAIGRIPAPVIVIPGNHDHGGPGSVWHQAYFQQEQVACAPNLRVILEPGLVEVAGVAIFACPLLRRSEADDPTTWLRSGEAFAQASPGIPRLVLAHGATQQFGTADPDDEDAYGSNFLELARLPEAEFDYVALGDWHGTKQVGAKAWYAGAHEQDRFPRGEDYEAGNALLVDLGRGRPPQVERVRTGGLSWHLVAFTFHSDEDVDGLAERLDGLTAGGVDQHLVDLTLRGALGLAAQGRLDALLDRQRARLVRLKLDREVVTAPTAAELVTLTQREADPLIARVATRLVAESQAGGELAGRARIALRELYLTATAKQEA